MCSLYKSIYNIVAFYVLSCSFRLHIDVFFLIFDLKVVSVYVRNEASFKISVCNCVYFFLLKFHLFIVL